MKTNGEPEARSTETKNRLYFTALTQEINFTTDFAFILVNSVGLYVVNNSNR